MLIYTYIYVSLAGNMSFCLLKCALVNVGMNGGGILRIGASFER